MIYLKTDEDIEKLQEGGRLLAIILQKVAQETKPGVSSSFLDQLAYKLILQVGGKPSFLNYQPDFNSKPFPATLCVSINDVIVHGIPSPKVIIQEGDIVSLDIGMEYKGLDTDMAITIGIGEIKPVYKKLMKVTKEALQKGIEAAQPGNTIGDIGAAIQRHVEENGLAVVRDLGGHGVGYAPHEDPFIFNYGKAGQGLKLQPGMVIALEPMVTFGSGAIKENKDESFSTLNGKRAAHFEHTIAIIPSGNIVITAFPT